MADDPKKDYKNALNRVTTALYKFDQEAKGFFEAKKIHRTELTPAVEALLSAKLAALRIDKPEEPERKTKTLSDLNRKLFK